MGISALSWDNSSGDLVLTVQVTWIPTSLSESRVFVGVVWATSTRRMIPLEISRINHLLEVPFSLLKREGVQLI